MKNTNTHILCEPYEIENYIREEEIRCENFIEKTSELINSIKNTNYENLDSMINLDKSIKKEYINLEIPYNFDSTSLDLIYQYSNKIEIERLIITLKEKMKPIFELKNDTDLEDVKKIIEELNLFINEIKRGKCFSTSFKSFDKLASFDEILSIADSSFYTPLIEWISSFPNDLLNLEFDHISSTVVNNIEQSKDDESENNIFVKRRLLFMIYNLYNILVKNIIKTKIFWNSFLDLIEPDNTIDEFIESDSDEKINMILNELEELSDIDYDDLESDNLFGFEDGDFVKNRNKTFETVSKFFKEFPGKINKIRKQFKLFRMRAKNHAFYMKYMGRIEGLYERYADESPVLENGMIGDPVKILKDEAHEYISEVSNSIVDLQNNLIDLSKKFASIGDPKQMFQQLKSFGGMYMSDVQKSSSIVDSFLRSMRFKVGEIITKGNKIYGYTPQSIAENKKMPPSNHSIVSLFVDRPDEKPFEQKVSDIIKDVDSFKLIAKNEKEPVFEVTMLCSDILTKGIQKESYKFFKDNKAESKEKFELKIKDLIANSDKPKKERKKLISQFKACWKALEKSYDYSIKAKSYVSDLIQSYFVMMTRIDNLCKVCLTSLLHTETMHKEESYKIGFKADKLNSHGKYMQYNEEEENRKTAGEKQNEKMNKKIDKSNEYEENKKSILEHSKKIKEAMRKSRFGI